MGTALAGSTLAAAAMVAAPSTGPEMGFAASDEVEIR